MVMVLEKGFAWNGRTYRSLSQVARAMTGTSWNGHRFFGLRTSKSYRAARPGRCSEVDADTANVGAGTATLVQNAAGQSVSNATLTPGGKTPARSSAFPPRSSKTGLRVRSGRIWRSRQPRSTTVTSTTVSSASSGKRNFAG